MMLIIIKFFWHVICSYKNKQIIPIESNSIEEVLGTMYQVLA